MNLYLKYVAKYAIFYWPVLYMQKWDLHIWFEYFGGCELDDFCKC